MKKILCYSFGIIAIVCGLFLMYCVFTHEQNQNVYIAVSLEMFLSAGLFLFTLKLFKIN